MKRERTAFSPSRMGKTLQPMVCEYIMIARSGVSIIMQAQTAIDKGNLQVLHGD